LIWWPVVAGAAVLVSVPRRQHLQPSAAVLFQLPDGLAALANDPADQLVRDLHSFRFLAGEPPDGGRQRLGELLKQVSHRSLGLGHLDGVAIDPQPRHR